MPFSQSSQITAIVGFIEQLQPRSLLDVGVGMGQYGFMARTFLESTHLFVIEGSQGRQRDRSEWKVRIDGIEGFAGYLTPVHSYSYNNIMIGDARELLATVPDGHYELVIAIDILEHLDKQDGIAFLKQLRRICTRAALVSTPKDFIHQEVDANPFENHRSHWSLTELQACNFTGLLDNPESWIATYRA